MFKESNSFIISMFNTHYRRPKPFYYWKYHYWSKLRDISFATGTRIIYERKFLMELRNSPLARTPPVDLPVIPGVTCAENTKVEVQRKVESEPKPIAGGNSAIVQYWFFVVPASGAEGWWWWWWFFVGNNV